MSCQLVAINCGFSSVDINNTPQGIIVYAFRYFRVVKLSENPHKIRAAGF
jgi:hypothetical protein